MTMLKSLQQVIRPPEAFWEVLRYRKSLADWYCGIGARSMSAIPIQSPCIELGSAPFAVSIATPWSKVSGMRHSLQPEIRWSLNFLFLGAIGISSGMARRALRFTGLLDIRIPTCAFVRTVWNAQNSGHWLMYNVSFSLRLVLFSLAF